MQPVRKHPAKLDLGDYLPYLVNRVGTIIAEQFGDDALARHGLSIADVAGPGGAGEQWRPAPDRSRRFDQHRGVDLVAAGQPPDAHGPCHAHPIGEQQPRSRGQAFAKGQTLVARLIPIARDYEAAAIAGLSASELAALKRCLRRMYGNMKSRQASFATAAQ